MIHPFMGMMEPCRVQQKGLLRQGSACHVVSRRVLYAKER